MKFCHLIAIGLLVVAQSAAAQETSVADYFAAFDRARAKLMQAGDDVSKPETKTLHDRLSGELEAMMRRIVGPVIAPKGFSGKGGLNAELWPGVGSDRLDGIKFWNGQLGDSWAYLVVTTDDVMRRWLAKNRADKPEVQADLDGGFQSGKLAAQIVNDDGWMSRFAFLAVDKPKGVDAVTAFVGEGGNGDLIWPPTLLSVYLRKGHRIYLADVALTTKFAPIEACDAIRTADWARATSTRRSSRFLKALDGYNKCWEERGKAEPAFAAAVKQAQALVDDLAGL